MKSKRLTFIVAVVAASLCFSAFKVKAETLITRYNGTDRYETAAKVCQDGWKSSKSVVIVNGENFPDALAAAPLAKKNDAPILLTSKDILNPYTSVEINRLGVKNAFIIGGRGVISQAIEDSLKFRGIKVTRLGGADRYDTAIQIAGKLGKSNEIALVNSNDFRDGMSIAAIAAAKGMPVIPVDTYSIPASVSKYLQGYKKADQIYVVGGQDKISDSVISGLPNVKRIGGGDGYTSNIGVVNAFLGELKTDTIYISSAKDFPDSLGASALAPKTFSPIIFVDSPMSYATQNFLKSHIVNNIKVLGGPGAVSYESEQIAQKLPSAVASIDNVTDTIIQNEKYTPRPTMIVTASDGNKKEVNVDWNLTKINTSKPGIYTFQGTIHGTDKTVVTTLIVKPIPYKIDDITRTAVSRDKVDLPTTITAQMTDGTKIQVPVTWDYGTQSGNKPGVYVFYGTVANYSKKVKLTLTVDASSSTSIASIKDFKKVFATTDEMKSYIASSLPSTAAVTMSDGTTKTVSITWDAASTLTNGAAKGTHILKGTVANYPSKVNYLMIVTSEGGVDPDPNNNGNQGNNNNNNNQTIEVGDLTAIMQGDSYPTTVTDPATKKQMQVTWTNAVSIDSSSNVGDKNVKDLDNCRISKISLEGKSGTTTTVKATIGIIPKILGITASGDDNTDISPALVVDVKRSELTNGVIDMSTISDKYLRAVVLDPNTKRKTTKKVTVNLWNPPYIDVSDANMYYVTVNINHYNTPLLITIRVIN